MKLPVNKIKGLLKNLDSTEIEDVISILGNNKKLMPLITRLRAALLIIEDTPNKAKRYIYEVIQLLPQFKQAKTRKTANRRFLDFNHTQGVETDSYATQPGHGHPQSSGKVFLDETGQGVNVDVANEFWNKSDNKRQDYPVGENSKPTGYRGPHNDREIRRMPVRTIQNVIPPRGVPR